MSYNASIKKCKMASNQIRKDIIDMAYSVGNVGAHLGGSLSIADILAVLYVYKIRYDAENPDWDGRDRVVLSKGHAALALYPALVQAGIIARDRLDEFKRNGSQLSGHPSLNGIPGIEFASGSLGQGLSLGVGTALALKRKKNMDAKVYVLLGDGECDEGSIWEAAASAAHFGLNNIVAIVDANQIQYDGSTNDIMNMNPMRDKWEAFGWKTLEIDGHNVEEIMKAVDKESNFPIVIIANTVKGKGISFMEGDKRYHNARITKDQYEVAMDELRLMI